MITEEQRKGAIEALCGLTDEAAVTLMLEACRAAHTLDMADQRLATILSYRMGELMSTHGMLEGELVLVTLRALQIKRGDVKPADSRAALRNAAVIDLDYYDRTVD